MECIICNSKMELFFSKEFHEFNLDNVDYFKCNSCGFCNSKTHYELSIEDWSVLNYSFHTENNDRGDNPWNRNQRYFNQSLMLSLMQRVGLVNDSPILDWGAGNGSVSILSKELFENKILNYDKFIEPLINPVSLTKKDKKSFKTVLNCGVFEHVTSRDTLDEIESYVSADGCLAVHTLIQENIPDNPNWMYLLPVHCSFHTNKSMSILMEQWGYKCSVYNETSKLWVLFKTDFNEINKKAQKLNNLMGWEYLKIKNGFMDYWK